VHIFIGKNGKKLPEGSYAAAIRYAIALAARLSGCCACAKNAYLCTQLQVLQKNA